METRSLIFLIIMIAVGAVALAVFVVFLVVRLSRRSRERAAEGPAAGEETAAAGPAPAAVRMLGLLALGLALLILYWRWLDDATGYAVMVYAVYPAALALGLVLLFDKATRSWSYKGAMAGLREWLFCDTLVFLLLLAFVNLWMSGAGEAYRSLFWDALGLALTLFVFWLVDRKFTRYRFLVAYGYLVLLPILLLIWATVQDVPARVGVDQRAKPAAAESAVAAEEAAPSEEEDTFAPKPAKPDEEDTFAPKPAKSAEPSAASKSSGDEETFAPKATEQPAGQEQAAAAEVAEPPPPASWWETIWPFFAWAGAFFLLEIIGLIAIAESDRSIVLLIKDLAFVIGYAVLLLVAAK